jgi:hypothetical protein
MAIIPVPYHIGIVVTELDESMAMLTAALGIRWCRPQSGPVILQTREGRIEATVSFVYSIDGPPHFELIGQLPGTVWSETGLHHLGLWSDDPTSESRRLDALGCSFECVNVDTSGEWTGGLYHSTADGLRLEIVDAETSGPKLTRYLTGLSNYA